MPRTLHTILSEAITRIAQKACRNGESSERTWPSLSELPLRASWVWVGEHYAPEIVSEIAQLVCEAQMTIERDVAIARAMREQDVVSSLSLRGPLGDELRAEVRPHIEALVAKGVISSDIWALYKT